MSRRRVGLALGLLAVTLVGGYLFVGSLIYDKVSLTEANCGGRWPANTPSDFTSEDLDTQPFRMPIYEAVRIASREPSISLHGLYIPATATPNAGTILIVHGHNVCVREPQELVAAGMAHRFGYAVLLIDLRNHGDSTIVNGRHAGGTNEYRDVLGAWDWLVTAKGVDPARIGLLGFSLGAATVIMAAGEEPRVAAVWEDSSYADLRVALRAELTRNGYPTFFEYAAYLAARVESGDDLLSLSPFGAMAKLHGRPLYIVHGTADSRLSTQYANDLAVAYRAGGGKVEPWIVDGSEHIKSILDHPGDYEQRLSTFFGTAIGQPPAGR